MASLDLEKAFDRILHAVILGGLEDCHVESCIAAAIKSVYWDNAASVQIDSNARSRIFRVLRGVVKEILFPHPSSQMC